MRLGHPLEQIECNSWGFFDSACILHASGLHAVSACTDIHSDAVWRLEVIQSLTALLKQPSTALILYNSARVGFTQAIRVLASLDIAECVEICWTLL